MAVAQAVVAAHFFVKLSVLVIVIIHVKETAKVIVLGLVAPVVKQGVKTRQNAVSHLTEGT